eukprot:1144696-Amphidinium_carterae.1
MGGYASWSRIVEMLARAMLLQEMTLRWIVCRFAVHSRNESYETRTTIGFISNIVSLQYT